MTSNQGGTASTDINGETGNEIEAATAARRPGEWVTHSTLEAVYDSWWVTLRIDDVERPDGTHARHEVVVGPDAAGMVALDDERGILMIYRHRFMPDVWEWEIPGGAVDPGEDPETAARRECHEESGWIPAGDVELLAAYHPSVGLVKQTFYVYLATAFDDAGAPLDANEAARVEWRSFEQVADDLATGLVADGFSQVGVTMAFIMTGRAELIAEARRRHGAVGALGEHIPGVSAQHTATTTASAAPAASATDTQPAGEQR